MNLHIRAAVQADAAAIAAIYRPFVENTTVSYELSAPEAAEMAERIAQKQREHGWLVLEDEGGAVQGYAYYGEFRARPAYRHVVESSVYLAPAAQGLGAGRRLYEALIDHARARGYREMIAVIDVPNPASEAFHRQLGFVEAGLLRRAGHKFGRYLDTAFWQRAID